MIPNEREREAQEVLKTCNKESLERLYNLRTKQGLLIIYNSGRRIPETRLETAQKNIYCGCLMT